MTTEEKLAQALRAARKFIVNGCALGFIRMPDADCPDAAHKTLPMIEAALAEYDSAQASKASGDPTERQGQKPESVVHGEWLPIETVPPDATVILANFTERCLLTGAPHVWTATYVTKWADLKTGQRVEAAPLWTECSHAATNENGDPTHWMPLPSPPQAAPDRVGGGDV